MGRIEFIHVEIVSGTVVLPGVANLLDAIVIVGVHGHDVGNVSCSTDLTRVLDELDIGESTRTCSVQGPSYSPSLRNLCLLKTISVFCSRGLKYGLGNAASLRI